MNNNPFLSKTFTSIWSKHFNSSIEGKRFNFIENVSFIKNKYLPFYYNVGKNITNGLSYSLNKHENDYKNKTFLIHDVPSYFNIETNNTDSSLKIKKIKQYKGFLTDLSQHKSFEEFFNAQYKSSSRYKFKKKTQRLNTCFDVKYSIFCDEIQKEEYDIIMKRFEELITSRFGKLEKDNDVLAVWKYYEELFYPMMLDKQALLITVNIEGKQAGGALCFLGDQTLYYAITTFDSDYFKFNLGHEIIMKLLNWCYDNDYNVYDFSKGEYEYKTRWTNTIYNYECHVLYDSNSVKSLVTAYLISNYFTLKQYLRDKNVNERYVKLKFLLKGNKSVFNQKRKYSIVKSDSVQDISQLELINIDTEEFSFLKALVYDELKTLHFNSSETIGPCSSSCWRRRNGHDET